MFGQRKARFLLFFVCCSLMGFGQSGFGTYKVLDVPASARVAAMGGSNVSLYDNDLSLALLNPALLSPKTHNVLTFNYTNYLSDVNYGSVLYGRNFGERNFTSYGINYIDYGKFISSETGENDALLKFTAKDFVIHASYARLLSERWTIGLTLKPMLSVYERYKSFGFAVDAGLSYADQEHHFYAGLVVRNIGMSINGYKSIDGKRSIEMTPWDIQLGLTKGFKHAPLRLSMTIHSLQKWDLSATDATTIEKPQKSNANKFFNNLFSHAIFNLEILPIKNLYLLVSYNHRRGRDLYVQDFKTAAGFAFGAGLKVHNFHIDLGFSQYQVGNFSYHVTFTTYMADFGVK